MTSVEKLLLGIPRAELTATATTWTWNWTVRFRIHTCTWVAPAHATLSQYTLRHTKSERHCFAMIKCTDTRRGPLRAVPCVDVFVALASGVFSSDDWIAHTIFLVMWTSIVLSQGTFTETSQHRIDYDVIAHLMRAKFVLAQAVALFTQTTSLFCYGPCNPWSSIVSFFCTRIVAFLNHICRTPIKRSNWGCSMGPV